MSEEQLQGLIFQHHWNNFPAERGRLFHVNQKARNAIEGNRLKAIGVVPGISDLVYLLPGTVAWLELKTETGIQSTEQRRFETLVTSLGMRYQIIRSLEAFLQFRKSVVT